jgi:hypothetical protein
MFSAVEASFAACDTKQGTGKDSNFSHKARLKPSKVAGDNLRQSLHVVPPAPSLDHNHVRHMASVPILDAEAFCSKACYLTWNSLLASLG